MKEILKELEIEVYPVNLLNRNFYFASHDNRLILLYSIIEEFDAESIRLFLTEFSTKENRTIVKKRLSGLKEFDITPFLWDLYFILIDKNKILSPEQINKIERDKYIARKIVIQQETEEGVIEALNDLLFAENQYGDLFESVKENLKTDETEILKAILSDEIEKLIKDELQKDKLSLNDINEFLNKKQLKY